MPKKLTQNSDSKEVERFEERLLSLEQRLVSHAEELKSQLSDRVMRIHSRVERAMRSFQPESERQRFERVADNVVEFGFVPARETTLPEAHLLNARNARAAIRELNETLRQTREHLEALSGSVEKMRRAVSVDR